LLQVLASHLASAMPRIHIKGFQRYYIPWKFKAKQRIVFRKSL